jgi:hypothetical protein
MEVDIPTYLLDFLKTMDGQADLSRDARLAVAVANDTARR